ncbi:ABC transporter permease [Halopenitus sp. POP-27]|uniref:ABC transporter permease n=1 Tax=Halopenitus sp. POP-27 TaxID=2994425 RepID=UPI002468AFA8|nr:ABC transporter permease [Halopenitus sp. POP-27]
MATVEDHDGVTAIGERLTAWVRDRSPSAIGFPRRALGLVVPGLLVVGWHLLVTQGVFQPHQLPAPTTVLSTFAAMGASGELWGHLSVTIQRVAFGVLFGVTAGILFGTITGLFGLANDLLDPLLQSMKNIPSLAWVPLFLLWFGIGESAKVTLIALGAFFPVYLNLSTGIQGIDEDLLEVVEVYDVGRLETLRRVVFPAALPNLLVGIRGGVGLAWMFVVAAELIAASQGLGFLLSDGRVLARPDIIVGSILLFASLGNLSDIGVKALQRRLVYWSA